MSKATVIKTTSGGGVITVAYSAVELDKTLDGYRYGTEVVGSFEEMKLEHNGELIISFAGAPLLKSYPNMPKGAYAVIKGLKKVQPISKEVYDIILEACRKAKAEANAEFEQKEEVTETEVVDGSAQEEQDYDNLYNEGYEGFNPYRGAVEIKTNTVTVIEQRPIERDYEMQGVQAIIDHPTHGRLLIEDGFGGMDTLEGGAVRWEHGGVIKLKANDTLSSMENESWNDHCDLLSVVLMGRDDERPVMEWDGFVIRSVAESFGL